MKSSFTVKISVFLIMIFTAVCILPFSYSQAQSDTRAEHQQDPKAHPESEMAESDRQKHEKKTDQVLSENDPQYWMGKGGLYASYGNQEAAIKSFRKALELDPENIRAAFNLGLAYAENGDYDKALGFINKAVSRAPENGNYLYGRGWVHLLAGDPEKAMQAIGKAAALGNPDALEYMNSIAPRR